MGKVLRFVILTASILAGLAAIWTFRVRAAAYEAAQFAPAPAMVRPAMLPAGTAIEAVVTNGIPMTASPGDPVTAIIATPVHVDGILVIPSGAQLEGIVETVSKFDDTGEAQLRFSILGSNGRSVEIQTQTVVVKGPIVDDVEILTGALQSMMGATLGAAIGAETGDVRLIERGVIEGLGSSAPTDNTVSVMVVLARDLAI
jgi:hypothetical protein